ncbi:coatomer subunit beta-1-like [Pyrus ussuriensis x Pyrus communis]|uniref:Coatomer subunit beta-1-like n=1 Tax=Pyrus ussuriensis x Pyrus communis TaxID=2448454 RepID=A0A5N5GC31_9ROSA|nr:coatomer subunit beta-1-like [Pyrus ussuriensis x Pyrus communis]
MPSKQTPRSHRPPHFSNSDLTFPISDPPRSSPTSSSLAIMLLLNDDTIPHLFITIIRYVLPFEDHTVQKLLHLYLKIIDKTNSKGKIIEPLIPSILANLKHCHPFMQRNAVLAIMSVPDAAGGDVVRQSARRKWRKGRWIGGRVFRFSVFFFNWVNYYNIFNE